MAMPLSATFDYATEVPDHEANAQPWRMRLETPVKRRGNPLADARLVGHSPTLTITDAGRANDDLPSQAPRILDVARSRLTLVASSRTDASVAQASFFVATALVAALRPGDSLHMARNGAAGLSISVIRGGQCVLAAGAVSDVPLGAKIRVRLASDELHAAEAAFYKRDPDFEFPDIPLDVTIGDKTKVMFRGRLQLGAYEVFVVRPWTRGFPGTSECVGLSHTRLCEVYAANASAQLLQGGKIELVIW
jgi:hypothetical protein